MKKEKLRAQAASIEAAIEEGETAVFVVGSGDLNYKDVPREDVLSINGQFAYEIRRSTMWGWSYYRGSPSSFDGGKFEL